jgi:two-component system nitrate/nitrite response regulator NarL
MKRAAGRPARPIDEGAPYRDFAEHLREIRRAADLTLRKLSERTGYSIGWLSEAESGERLPSLEGTLVFACACGANSQAWTRRWREAAKQVRTETKVEGGAGVLAAELDQAGAAEEVSWIGYAAGAETNNLDQLQDQHDSTSTGDLWLPADQSGKPSIGDRTGLHDPAQASLQAASDLEGPEAPMPPLGVVARAQENALGGSTTEQQIRVAIVEDHPVAAEGVASWIRSDPRQQMRVVQMMSDLTGLRAISQPAADVIILDLELSGELVTTQIPELVAAGYRVVAFSGHSDTVTVMEALDNGAHAYVTKGEGRDHLAEAVLAAAADQPYVTRSQARAMLFDKRPARPALSEQERQALMLWFQGMSKASVGRRMSISENTVRQYISRARAKYAATGRTAASKDALLARAIEDRVIRPDEIVSYRSFARGATDRPGLGGLGQ